MIEEDPRRELVARLVEYKRFKQAAMILQEQEEAAESIFEKPREDISEYLDGLDEYLSLDLKQFAAFSIFHRKEAEDRGRPQAVYQDTERKSQIHRKQRYSICFQDTPK